MIQIRANKFIAASIDNRWRSVRILSSAVAHGVHPASVDGKACRIEVTGFGWRVL